MAEEELQKEKLNLPQASWTELTQEQHELFSKVVLYKGLVDFSVPNKALKYSKEDELHPLSQGHQELLGSVLQRHLEAREKDIISAHIVSLTTKPDKDGDAYLFFATKSQVPNLTSNTEATFEAVSSAIVHTNEIITRLRGIPIPELKLEPVKV